MNRREYLRKWRRTKGGLIQNCWTHINERVTKPQSTAFGLPRCEKDEFYKWAKESEDLDRLMDEWEKSSYNSDLTPCILRLNTRAGFVPMFLTWVTRREINQEGAFHLNGGIR